MTQATTLYDRLEESIISGQPALWIRTHEPDEALLVLHRLEKEYEKEEMPLVLQIWNCQQGVLGGDDNIPGGRASALGAITDMIHKAHKELIVRRENPDTPIEEHRRILILQNGHREFGNASMPNKDMLMATQLFLQLADEAAIHLIILGVPGVELPIEFSQQFWVLDHELPGEQERQEIIQELLAGHKHEPLPPERMAKVVQICSGLTRKQVAGVCAISLAQDQQLDDKVLYRLKVNTINQAGLLELSTTQEAFKTRSVEIDGKTVEIPGMGGYSAIKRYGKALCRIGLQPKFRPKGILIIGPPGTGKTMFCRALGYETGRLPMEGKLGRLRGSLVGQTEERTEEMLRTADNCEPGVLFIDEIEKYIRADEHGLSHETSEHVKGELLKWMQDHTSDVALICTANDVRNLPPEFGRTGRIDLTFFMGYPDEEAKIEIWKTYLRHFELAQNFTLEDLPENTDYWVGSDIRGCCFLAGMMRQSQEPEFTLEDAAKLIRPAYLKYQEQIEGVLEWANGVAIDAETGNIFDLEKYKEKMSDKIMLGPIGSSNGSARSYRKTSRKKKQ